MHAFRGTPLCWEGFGPGSTDAQQDIRPKRRQSVQSRGIESGMNSSSPPGEMAGPVYSALTLANVVTAIEEEVGAVAHH